MREHPLPAVFAKLTEAEPGSKTESDLCAFLEKMLQTAPGCYILPSAMPYAAAGLAADSPRVRSLACSQIGRAMAFFPDVAEASLPSLVEALADPDGGVAKAAAASLANLAGHTEEVPSARQLSSVSPPVLAAMLESVTRVAQQHPSPEVRLRAYALAATVAGRSRSAAEAVASAGLMTGLLREVEGAKGDVLAAMAAMELLAEIAEASPEAAAGLGSIETLLQTLARVVSSGDGHVRERAAAVGARIAAAGAGAHAGALPPGSSALVGSLEDAMTSPEAEPGAAEAAVTALGCLAESEAGSEAMCSRAPLVSALAAAALGGGTRVDTRVAALHALASLAGAGVDNGNSRPVSARHVAVVKDSVYDAVGGSTPADRVWALLERGGDAFLEVRVAAYRLIAALGRQRWFAREVSAHAALFAKVSDAAGESTPPACRWRHEAARGLLAAAEEEEAAAGQTTRGADVLAAAVAAGPFGAGGGVTWRRRWPRRGDEMSSPGDAASAPLTRRRPDAASE